MSWDFQMLKTMLTKFLFRSKRKLMQEVKGSSAFHIIKSRVIKEETVKI